MSSIYNLFNLFGFVSASSSESVSSSTPLSRPPAKMPQLPLPSSSESSGASKPLQERQVSIITSSSAPLIPVSSSSTSSTSSTSSSLSSSVPVPSSSSSSSEEDRKKLADKELEEAAVKLKEASAKGIKMSSFFPPLSPDYYSLEATRKREPYEAAFQLYSSSPSVLSSKIFEDAFIRRILEDAHVGDIKSFEFYLSNSSVPVYPFSKEKREYFREIYRSYSSLVPTAEERLVWEEWEKTLKEYQVGGEQLGFLIPFFDSSKSKNLNFFTKTRGSFRIFFRPEDRKWVFEMRTLDYRVTTDYFSFSLDGNLPKELLSKYLHPSEQYKRIDRVLLQKQFGVILPETPVVKDGKIEIFMPSSPREPLLVDYDELLTFKIATAILTHPDGIKACSLLDKEETETLEDMRNYRSPK